MDTKKIERFISSANIATGMKKETLVKIGQDVVALKGNTTDKFRQPRIKGKIYKVRDIHYCPKCGQEVGVGRKFCPACGSQL